MDLEDGVPAVGGLLPWRVPRITPMTPQLPPAHPLPSTSPGLPRGKVLPTRSPHSTPPGVDISLC